LTLRYTSPFPAHSRETNQWSPNGPTSLADPPAAPLSEEPQYMGATIRTALSQIRHMTATSKADIPGQKRMSAAGRFLWVSHLHLPGGRRRPHRRPRGQHLGRHTYGFSISWPRALPRGRGQRNTRRVMQLSQFANLLFRQAP
jgi:hypothetical protein